MTVHVLVFDDHPGVRAMLTAFCEDAGYLVTSAATLEDALIVLRSSLHPLVAIIDAIHSPADLLGFFFGTVTNHPDWYGQHHYVALHARDLSESDQALLCELGAAVLRQPFDVAHLLDRVAAAASSFP